MTTTTTTTTNPYPWIVSHGCACSDAWGLTCTAIAKFSAETNASVKLAVLSKDLRQKSCHMWSHLANACEDAQDIVSNTELSADKAFEEWKAVGHQMYLGWKHQCTESAWSLASDAETQAKDKIAKFLDYASKGSQEQTTAKL